MPFSITHDIRLFCLVRRVAKKDGGDSDDDFNPEEESGDDSDSENTDWTVESDVELLKTFKSG